MNPPRGVLLDLGNTLLRELGFDPEAGTRRLLALAKHNPRDVSAEQLRTHAERIVEAMQGRRFESQIEFPASATTRLIYDSAGIELACEDPDLEFWRASMRMEPEPHVATVLDDLARRRLPLGVVSNSAFAGNVLCDELERHGLLDRFRFVMASCDYGFRKPHPLLFEAAAARLGLDPRDVWFIGDSLTFDVGGARSVGMTAIWYNTRGLAAEGPEAHAEIRDWREFGDLLP